MSGNTTEVEGKHVAQLKHRQERDRRVMAHQLHMRNAEQLGEQSASKQGYSESENPDEGIDQDMLAKAGRVAQILKEKTGSMRSRIRKSRIRARSLAKGIV